MSTLFWVVMAAALVWAVWKLSRSGSPGSDGDSSSTYFSDGGGTTSGADCSDSASDGGSCDGGGGDGGGGD